jgi:2-dehydro-3-deoxygluconokinase
MVLTFGELLLRLSPQLGGEWIEKAQIPTFVGGAELNAATALAAWNIPVAYFTALPEHALSVDIVKHLEKKQIDTQRIHWGGDRIGIYMLPQGADLKSAGVIYDRADSSFSRLKVEDIKWDFLFSGITHFHLSAISPALNQQLADLCVAAAREAAMRGITVTFDLNYRAKLWKYGKEPIEIISQIIPYCDLVMGNIWASNTLLGLPIDADVKVNKAGKEQYIAEAQRSAKAMMEKYPNVSKVAYTFRFDAPPNGIQYFSTWHSEQDFVVSSEFDTPLVVDKVGSGDCFMAGLLYGLYRNLPAKETIDFAASAAFGKLQEYGDATAQSEEDVLNRLKI